MQLLVIRACSAWVHRTCLITIYQYDYQHNTMISVQQFTFTTTGWSKKTDPLVNFDNNFGKHGTILTIFSLLQQEIYGAQYLSYFSHLTFIMLLHYLAKQTLIQVSMLHVLIKLMVHSQTLKK